MTTRGSRADRGSRRLPIALLAIAACAATRAEARPRSAPGELRSVVEAGRYRLQSNAWVNLHQRLMYEARFGVQPHPAGLSDDDISKWKKAIEDYRAYLGKRSPIFDEELKALNAALAATDGARPPDSIPKAAAVVLGAAMPLYRVAQWEVDDRANRFWMAVAEPLLAAAGEELAEEHSKAYSVPFPKHVYVDVVSFGWEFGAYTVGEGDPALTVIQSTDPGNQGFRALEALMHEPSHVIVGPRSGAIGTELSRASRETGLRPEASLWHAILFYTSSELTRRALAKRGVPDYHPVIVDMYDRGFRDFRKALETHWQDYLDGKVARDEAIRQILIETAPPQRK